MLRRRLNAIAVSFLVVCLFSATLAPVTAAQRSPRSAAAATKPKLVVIMMVDQFRYDFLERFSDLFGNDGFKRLMSGAFFTNANYDYVPTVTAAGHAAVHTGSVPAMNGVNGNIIIDPDTGKSVAFVYDPATHPVTNGGVDTKVASASPRNMSGSTIGDQLRLSNNFQSKVI